MVKSLSAEAETFRQPGVTKPLILIEETKVFQKCTRLIFPEKNSLSRPSNFASVRILVQAKVLAYYLRIVLTAPRNAV